MAISLFISYFFSVVRTFSNAITLCQSPCLANKWHFGLFPSTAVSMLKVDVFCKTEKIAGYEKGKNTLPGYFIGSPHHKQEQSWWKWSRSKLSVTVTLTFINDWNILVSTYNSCIWDFYNPVAKRLHLNKLVHQKSEQRKAKLDVNKGTDEQPVETQYFIINILYPNSSIRVCMCVCFSLHLAASKSHIRCAKKDTHWAL